MMATNTQKEWSIPAKTFLLGEYAALAGHSSIILTTTPHFKVTLTEQTGLQGIHPESPAGRLWARSSTQHHHGIHWEDPYQGLGGMGASSAQFIGAYLATAYLNNIVVTPDSLLATYKEITYDPKGLPPSGYDVLAQFTAHTNESAQCVYLNQNAKIIQTYAWPFQEVGFILVHTRQKLATHHHLQSLNTLNHLEELSSIVDSAKQAFDHQDSQSFIQTIQHYHQALTKRNWVASHTLDIIQKLQTNIDALAIKGCGALGADVVLLLVEAHDMPNHRQQLMTAGWHIIATS